MAIADIQEYLKLIPADDVIIRYEGDDVIGFTVLHASKRLKKSA